MVGQRTLPKRFSSQTKYRIPVPITFSDLYTSIIIFYVDVYRSFDALKTACYSHFESVKNYESHFEAHILRFKAYKAGSSTNFPSALSLLANTKIDYNRSVSILVAPVNLVKSSSISNLSAARMLIKINFYQLQLFSVRAVAPNRKTAVVMWTY